MLRFPVIIGPTAGGKSAVAVAVAEAFARRGARAEIVTADAFQVFRGMDIGTAKPSIEERRGVPHHVIDVVEPTQKFSVSQWLDMAERAVTEIKERGGVPIVAGGTHLYIKAFLDGLFEGPAPDPGLRAELGAMDPLERRRELERVDPAAAGRIHPNDARRTIRALEVFRQTGRPISALQEQWDRGGRTDCVLVGLEWDAAEISRRINARVHAMMEAGLLEEVRGLRARLGPQAREALGYKQLLTHVEGREGLQEAVEAIKIETRRFAKNQRTWTRRLRNHAGSVWISADRKSPVEIAQLIVKQCVVR